MKTIHCILLAFLILTPAFAGNPVSVDDLKKAHGWNERMQLVEQAPPEQREKLKKIALHLYLADILGGEEGLKQEKESYVAKARGFEAVEDLFVNIQMHLWDEYAGGVYKVNHKAGLSHEQLVESEKQLTQERSVLVNRLPVVHAIIFNMAPSTQALELEKRVEKLSDALMKKYYANGPTPEQGITREQLTEANKQIDAIFEEMKKLPTLTPDQAQKEYNAFPEEKIRASYL